MNRHLLFAGRLFIAALFLAGALGKARAFDSTSAQLADFGFGGPNFLLMSVIAFELITGVMLAAGIRTRSVSWVLAGYVALITLVVHRDVAVAMNLNFALANLGLIGGLLGIAAQKGPPFSVDERRMRSEANMAAGRIGGARLHPVPVRPAA